MMLNYVNAIVISKDGGCLMSETSDFSIRAYSINLHIPE